MAEVRSFIAIAMDPAMIEQLATLQMRLRQAQAEVSWARPEGMHITLKFLGNVPEERLAAIGDALAAVAGRHAPFRLSVCGTGGFPNHVRPRVVWAAIDHGAEIVRALAAEVDDALNAFGFPREKRAFSPHITLGRVKSIANVSPLMSMVEEAGDTLFGEMTVQAIYLMRSDLSPRGATYTTVRTAELAQG